MVFAMLIILISMQMRKETRQTHQSLPSLEHCLNLAAFYPACGQYALRHSRYQYVSLDHNGTKLPNTTSGRWGAVFERLKPHLEWLVVTKNLVWTPWKHLFQKSSGRILMLPETSEQRLSLVRRTHWRAWTYILRGEDLTYTEHHRHRHRRKATAGEKDSEWIEIGLTSFPSYSFSSFFLLFRPLLHIIAQLSQP